MNPQRTGPCLNIKTVFPGIGIPMIKIRRLWDCHDCLIFIMSPMLVRRLYYVKTAPVIISKIKKSETKTFLWDTATCSLLVPPHSDIVSWDTELLLLINCSVFPSLLDPSIWNCTNTASLVKTDSYHLQGSCWVWAWPMRKGVAL